MVIAVLAAAFGAAPLARAAGRPSQVYPPPLCTGATVSTALVPVGGSLTVSGCGFAPGSAVSIDILSHVVHLTTVKADEDGIVSADVTLPPEVRAGSHTIRLTGKDPDGAARVQEVCIEVFANEHGTPPARPGHGNGEHGQGQEAGGLAGTGVSGITFIEVLGGLLLGAGTLILVLVRSRRRRTSAG